jgi:tetratricopeptide (TPR) repeat protein
MSDRPYYQILNLEPGASPAEIKAAYRKLVKQWHPDRFSDPESRAEANEQIKRINFAYKTLKNLAEPPTIAPESPSPQSVSTPPTVHRTAFEKIYDRGAEHAKQGRYQEAIDDFSAVIRLCPTHAQAYRYRGFVRSVLGFERGAAADLERAEALGLVREGAKRSVNDRYRVPTRRFNWWQDLCWRIVRWWRSLWR